MRERRFLFSFATLVIAVGFTSSWISDEPAESWLYFLPDVAEASVAALLVRLAIRRTRQWREQHVNSHSAGAT
jgi:hypothetical protein